SMRFTEIRCISARYFIPITQVRNNTVLLVRSSPSATSDLNQLLRPVDDAAYSQRGRVARCLHGTREELIANIVRWIDKRSGHPICWLNGPAGAGKSAVSQTVAEWCDTKKRLA